MAEKAKKEAQPEPPVEKKEEKHPSSGKGAGMLGKTPIVLGSVMVLEAAVLFAGFKFLGGGAAHPVAGAEIADVEHGEHGEHGEGHGEHGGGGAAADKKRPVEI